MQVLEKGKVVFNSSRVVLIFLGGGLILVWFYLLSHPYLFVCMQWKKTEQISDNDSHFTVRRKAGLCGQMWAGFFQVTLTHSFLMGWVKTIQPNAAQDVARKVGGKKRCWSIKGAPKKHTTYPLVIELRYGRWPVYRYFMMSYTSKMVILYDFP